MFASVFQRVASRRSKTRGRVRRKLAGRRLIMEGLELRHLLATIVVDDDHAQCPNATEISIQDAVDAAQPGDTVQVCPGTYVEQVTIPNTKDGLVLKSTEQFEAVIKAPAGMTEPGIVHIDGADDVTISGFTITGPFTDLSGLRTGIFVGGGGSATIENNHITAIRGAPMNGVQNGVAILVGRGSINETGTAVIDGNVIDDYQKGGIVVDNVRSSATITNNEINGAGPTTAIAQNGIQVSGGATAEISDNLVSGNNYTPDGTVAAGILLAGSGPVTVENNTVTHNERGIDAEDADDLTIVGNDVIDNASTGIFLDAVTESLIAENLLKNNGGHGIFLGDSDDNNVRGNIIEGNDGDGIHVTGSSDSNVIENNSSFKNGGFDFYDDAVPGPGGTPNVWEDNSGKSSNRPDLADDKHKHKKDKKDKKDKDKKDKHHKMKV